MITRIKNGKVILADEIREAYVYFEDGKIISVTNSELPFDEEIDACGRYVSPGFIDIHVHGGGGFRFGDADKESLTAIVNLHAQHGTTTIYPTLSSFSNEKIIEVLETVKKFKDDEDVLPNIPGVHLEGPYCSKNQSGAQSANAFRDPVEDEYKPIVEKYGSLIKRWSYAPENEGAAEFQAYLGKNGILGSIGHSDAPYDDIMKAYAEGLRMVTHLYSCTSTITRVGGFRRLGVIETAYLYDDFYVETIADGCHLPPELLKLIYKIKGDSRVCLVTDSTRFGGVTDMSKVVKKGFEAPVIIEDGVAKIPDRTAFAGSIATADRLIRTCLKADIPLVSAVKMMTKTPAEAMGLLSKGRLCPGYDADIVIFDEGINISDVIIGGNKAK